MSAKRTDHVVRRASVADAADAGRLMHDFQVEYDDVTPGPEAFAGRLAELIERGDTVVVLGATAPGAAADGLAVLRLRPSLYGVANEAYLAELYVAPARRGQGLGEAVLAHALAVAREEGCDLIDLVTSEDDVAAQHLYAKLGFRRTEGDDGPLMLAFEQEL